MELSDLKQLRQWVGFTPDKVPMDPNTGRRAASNNPATWATAGAAWQAKKRHGWAGIGFMFTIDCGVVGIDLDHCFDGDQLKPHASDIVAMMDSYTERSPSGDGLHILVRGTIPHSLKTTELEMYNELRYFTVTGDMFQPGTTIQERQAELDALFVLFGGDFNDKPLPDVRGDMPSDVTETQIKEWLNALPAWGAYNDWLSACMAVHSVFPDERGVRLVEQWSPGKPGEVRRKFRSFDRTAKDGIRIGTLVHMAKEHGWQPPARIHKPKPARMSHAQKMAALAAA